MLERPEKAKAFDLWIRLSTHEKRKPIYLPVKLHEYFEERGGKLTGMVQITEDGKLRFVKEVERKEIAFSGEDLRGFLKRVINNFPKAIKRVLIRFVLGEIKKKLEEVREEYDIEVVYVAPAYSSQACSNCGYVDKDNRKTRSKFECELCDKKLHADVNASRNLLSGAKWSLHLHRMEQALTKQVEVFIKNLFSERFKCLWSKALGLIERNPYFQSVPKPEVWINVHKRDICPC